MDESSAVARLKQGDVGALEWLVKEYQTRALRTAYLIVHDAALSEDIVQSAFLRAFRNIHRFDPRRAFAPWFLKIVANDAIKALKQGSNFVSLDANPESGEFHFSSRENPEIALEQLQTKEEVWSLLQRLSPKQRAVVVLRYYAGLSSKEIAQNLDIPEGTVRWRLHAALDRLRGLLARKSKAGV
jgi:RNA polymerase sigma-70 factor (ECF subfamily)